MEMPIDYPRLIEFLRSEIDRRHPHKKPPYYFSKLVKEGNPTRLGLFDFLDDSIVVESLKDFCAGINTDWDTSKITELLMSTIFPRMSDQNKVRNVGFEATMRDKCAQIGSMIDDYLRLQTK
jgi:hypothetical protein